jgi:hypothetical protein
MAGYVVRMGKVWSVTIYSILVWKHDGRRLLGIPRHKWEDTIKINLKEKYFEIVDWIKVIRDKFQYVVLENGSIKCEDVLDQLNGYKLLNKYSALFT